MERISKQASHLKLRPELQIEYVATEALKASDKNPRKHGKVQLRQLKKNIQTFGFLVPMLADEHNTLITGAARLEVARQLAMPTVPVIRVTDLKPAEIQAFMIADNQLALNATWDNNLLGEVLVELTDHELVFDPDVLGFSMGQIDVIIEGMSAPAEDKADALPPSSQGPPIAQSGDLWLLGRHRLLCADATKPESYQRLMGNQQAGMIFTDPPYNVRIQGHVSGLGKVKHNEFAMASGEMTDEEFNCFLLAVCRHLAQFSRDGSIHYLFMDWRHIIDLLTAGFAAYSELKNLCVWVKDNGGWVHCIGRSTNW